MIQQSGVFSQIQSFPDPKVRARYANLVGIDDVKKRLLSEASLLVAPAQLRDWSRRFHGDELPIVKRFLSRPPLFLFAGDVGTGKTEVAETIGDAIARALSVEAYLYSMTLSARGTGTVGEMTTLITSAFSEVRDFAATSGGTICILHIDEADALAQSREFAQMHHEDRAGVNALIRGIISDRLS